MLPCLLLYLCIKFHEIQLCSFLSNLANKQRDKYKPWQRNIFTEGPPVVKLKVDVDGQNNLSTNQCHCVFVFLCTTISVSTKVLSVYKSIPQ